jgi:hypothetical protein
MAIPSSGSKNKPRRNLTWNEVAGSVCHLLSRSFLSRLFYPEDGVDMLRRNMGWLSTLYPRKFNFKVNLPWFFVFLSIYYFTPVTGLCDELWFKDLERSDILLTASLNKTNWRKVLSFSSAPPQVRLDAGVGRFWFRDDNSDDSNACTEQPLVGPWEATRSNT